MITLHQAKYRALRQMTKAIARGDANAALKWSLIFDGQLMIAKRFSDLQQRRPRRKPRKPAPKPAAAVEVQPPEPEQIHTGHEILDAPLHDPQPTGPRTWREFYHPEGWMFEEGRGPPVQLSERGRAGLLKPRPVKLPPGLVGKPSR